MRRQDVWERQIAVVFITLPPGGCTAQISSADGGIGKALAEIYAVP